MDEFFFLFVRIICETLFEIILWFPASLGLNRIYFIIAGVASGNLTVFIFPTHILPGVTIRFFNLIVTPFLIASCIGLIETKRKKTSEDDQKFIDYYLFTLSIALVRFFWAK